MNKLLATIITGAFAALTSQGQVIWQDADPNTAATSPEDFLIYESGNLDPAAGPNTVGRAYYSNDTGTASHPQFRNMGINGANDGFNPSAGTQVSAPLGGGARYANIDSSLYGKEVEFTVDVYIPSSHPFSGNDYVGTLIRWLDAAGSTIIVETPLLKADLAKVDQWQTLTNSTVSPTDTNVFRVAPLIATRDESTDIAESNTVYYVRNINFQLKTNLPAVVPVVWQDADPSTAASLLEDALIYESGTADPAGSTNTVGRAYYINDPISPPHLQFRNVGINGTNDGFNPSAGTQVSAPLGGGARYANIDSSHYGKEVEFTVDIYIPSSHPFSGNDYVGTLIRWQNAAGSTNIVTTPLLKADLAKVDQWQTLTNSTVAPTDPNVLRVAPLIATRDEGLDIAASNTMYYVRNINFQLKTNPPPLLPVVWKDIDPSTAGVSFPDVDLSIIAGQADPAGSTNTVGGVFYPNPTHAKFRDFGLANSGDIVVGPGTELQRPLGGGYHSASITDGYLGGAFTFTADVYIPAASPIGTGTDFIRLLTRLRDSGNGIPWGTNVTANLSTRDQWQTLTVSGTLPVLTNDITHVEPIIALVDDTTDIPQNTVVAYLRNVNFVLNPAVTVTAPTLLISPSGSDVVLNWTESGFKLQTQSTPLSVGLGTTWTDYALPDGTNPPVTVPTGPGASFFRLKSQ